jgi:hypothetical protein
MAKRRINRHFNKPTLAPPSPTNLTHFEQVVCKLKLKPNQYLCSEYLRKWAKHNRNSKYVPEWLLKAWGFDDPVMASDDNTVFFEQPPTLWPKV